MKGAPKTFRVMKGVPKTFPFEGKVARGAGRKRWPRWETDPLPAILPSWSKSITPKAFPLEGKVLD